MMKKKNWEEIPTTKLLPVFVLVSLNILDIDPVIVRLIWAAAIFLFGTGFLSTSFAGL